MKFKYLFIELCLIIAFFALPPVMVKTVSITSSANYFTWTLVFQALLAVLLDIQHHKFIKTDDKKLLYFGYFYHFALILGILMLVYAFFQLIAIIFPSVIKTASIIPFVKPHGFVQWVLFLLNLLIASYYEEVIYRQFLPCAIRFIPGKKKIIEVTAEVLSLLLFALGHRYLGYMAVINALICGSALRYCCYKTGSVYTGMISHFIYNLFLYILFFYA